LPLGADQRAQHEGRAQADQRVDEIGGLEGVERTTTSIILARKVDRGGMS